jgi:hypothetical protein
MDMDTLSWAVVKEKLREDILALPHFLKNPIAGMRQLPHWEWPTILILQAIFAALCSTIANLISRDLFGLLTGFIVVPIMNYALIGIVAGAFYYIFKLYFHREIAYRQVYLNVLFAAIPTVIMTTVTPLVPPLILVGSAASLLLLFVGCVDNFHLAAKPLRNIFFAIFAAHVLCWGYQQVQATSRHHSLQQRASPESLDILEREMQGDK